MIGPSKPSSPTLNAEFQAGRQWVQFVSFCGGQTHNLLDSGVDILPVVHWGGQVIHISSGRLHFCKIFLLKPVGTKAKIMSAKQKTSRVFLSLCFFQHEDVLINQPLLPFQCKSPRHVFILPFLWKILQVAKSVSFWSQYNNKKSLAAMKPSGQNQRSIRVRHRHKIADLNSSLKVRAAFKLSGEKQSSVLLPLYPLPNQTHQPNPPPFWKLI